MVSTPFALNVAAFVGVKTAGGFIPQGTCFFLQVASEDAMCFAYVVTCKHLVTDETQLRINRFQAPLVTVDMPTSEWIFHSDRLIDIAVAPFDHNRWNAAGDLQVTYIEAPEGVWGGSPPLNFFLCPGAELIIPSLFVPHPGELRNIAVIRRATLAAMPQEVLRYSSPTAPAYLVETRSLGGTSGSPVLVDLQPHESGIPYFLVNDNNSAEVPLLLLGMLNRQHAGNYVDDFAEVDENQKTADSIFNAGISSVLPISLVMDLIFSDELKNARRAPLAFDRKRVGVIPSMTSTRRAPPGRNALFPIETAHLAPLTGGGE